MIRKNKPALLILSILLALSMMLSDPATAFAAPKEDAQTAAKTVRISTKSEEAEDGQKAEGDDAGSEEAGDTEKDEGIFRHEDGESEKSKAAPVERMDITEMTEIKVGSFEEWEQFVKNCTLDSWSKDKYVVLTNDIDCNMQKFTPVPLFAGVFDGQGHTINKAAFTEEANYIGIFSRTRETAVIRNLNAIGVMKPGGKAFNIGGIVGDNYGMIANCKYDGYVEGYDYIGGIAGINEPSGVISACHITGKITGLHYVGGITGANMGLVTGCISDADINTVTKEVETGISDIKVEEVFTNLLNIGREEGNKKSILSSTNPVDIGGVAGNNTGEISSCENRSKVGYEHVGYNVGGIVGRQSGYVHDCSNSGKICGRKDVGGIVGQAEPYIRLDLDSDIIAQISTAISNLHDCVDQTIKDTDASSDVVSARLNVIKGFADKALNDTGYLANSTQDFVNGVVGSTNEVVGRIEYVMSESSKDDGPLADLSHAGGDLRDAAKDLEEVAEDLDLDNYLTDDEKNKYEAAKRGLVDATKEYDSYYKSVYDRYSDEEYRKEYVKLLYDTASVPDPPGTNVPTDADIEAAETAARAAGKTDEEIAEYKAAAKAKGVAKGTVKATKYADKEYSNKHGSAYVKDMEDYTRTVSGTIIDHADDMADDANDDAKDSIDNVKKMAGDLRDAGKSFRSIVKDVADRGPVRLPELSDEYRMHTNSLVFNIQGMSDNLGFLNTEMNGSTDTMCRDLEGVNDKFQTLMLLFTDAMDGALDMDYSEVFEDESNDVCTTSVDATVADCINTGYIYADINTGGIAGTMAQEYDFDLESDITGVKDASRNSTYRTKCVLRSDTNRGEVKGKKSYVGGACGLHEIGTILACGNFAKVSSESSDYVGGITGRSYSTIRDSYEKGILSGGSYIGGIAGAGVDISGCASMPTVTDHTNFVGAIEGDADDSGKLRGNVFVSDELAGVDRVSLEGAAEPVSYDTLLVMEGLPSDFRRMKVSFIVDGKTVAEVDRMIGEAVSPDEIDMEDRVVRVVSGKGSSDKDSDDNIVELADDEYISWECQDKVIVNADMQIGGSIVRFVSSLASEQTRPNNQSVFLVDGRFARGDALTVAALPVNDGDTEEYVIGIPDDSNDTHRIRYQMPEDAESVRIFTGEGTSQEEAVCDSFGKYITFMAAGENVHVKVLIGEKKNYMPWIIGGAAAVLLVIAAVIIISVVRRRKKAAKPAHLRPPKELEVEDIGDEPPDKEGVDS